MKFLRNWAKIESFQQPSNGEATVVRVMLDKENTNYSYLGSSYRPEIDGLRALAVVAVIINHFNKDILPSGYLGVDIFFVISGFVITSSLGSRSSKNFGEFLAEFYTRRIKRLVPALAAFVIVNSFLICLFNPSPAISLLTGLTSLFGLSNVFLLSQATDYFGSSSEINIFSHTWSLGVEEQFYFLFPLLCWLTGFSRLTVNGNKYLFFLMSVLSTASLTAFIYLYPFNQPAAYFLMPTRLWEMGVGCLLFLGLSNPSRLLSQLTNVSPMLVVTAIVAVLFIPMQFAIWATIAVVSLTAILIVCLRSGTFAYQLFVGRKVVYIGTISYSLYLWHWSVFTLSRWTIGLHWWSIAFQLFVVLLLSWLSYRFVESPYRKANIKKGVVFLSGGLILLTGVASVILLMKSSSALFLGTINEVKGGITPGFTTRHYKIPVSDCKLDRLAILENSATFSFLQQCNTKKSTDFDVYVTGDSHALDLFPALDEFSNTTGNSVLTTWQDGCRFPPRPGEGATCQLPEQILINSIDKSARQIVFVVRQNYSPKLPLELNSYIASIRKMVEKFSKYKNLKIVMIAPSPKSSLSINGGLCDKQPFRPDWAISYSCGNRAEPRSEQLARRIDYLNRLIQIQADFANFSIYDPFEALCARKQEYCTFSDGKNFYYRDDSHLTIKGSYALVPTFTEHLVKILGNRQ